MDWKLGPPVLVGEKVIWAGNVDEQPQTGTVRWMGKIPDFSSGWCVGIEFDKPSSGAGSDGFWMGRKLFECRPKQGLLAPIKEIQKLASKPNSRQSSIENHSDLKLDGSQFTDLTRSDLGRKSVKKNEETQGGKHRYSALELKLSEWSLKNRTSDRRSVSGLDFKNKNPDPQASKIEDVLDSFTARQQHILKAKKQDAKLSLRRKRRKRKPSHDSESRRHSRAEYDHRSVKGDVFETFPDSSENFENARTLDCGYLKNMNDVAGYFKEIKEDDGRYGQPPDKAMDEMLAFNLQDPTGPGPGKEKKFFSFLKWFKKNKDDPNLKLVKDASAASSPMFDRKRTSSCESVDTLFSTQTVRSFAYIPPTQYQPSAPPRSLLDSDNEESLFEGPAPDTTKPATEETESIYERRKKKRAPEPPRISRENSLPSTLEHKKNDEELEGAKTFHRRTVSESFKDRKAGAYCHVQGKRKAPLPPPPASSIYPNLQKLNNNNPYPSLYKKKKPAPPPPPDFKNDNEAAKPSVKDTNAESDTRGKPEEPIAKPTDSPNLENRERSSESCRGKLTKDVSLSPLPSRPWYKRSHRDSGGSSIIKKELLKGFEKKKNKETDDWMPEVGFSRRSLSTDSTHNKFNIFARLDKNEDKKKEEKRKSQISILTNISELDREAAEIVRKEQAEEKKMMAANDAKYYSPGSSANAFKNQKEAETLPEKDLADRPKPKEPSKSETDQKINKNDETPNTKALDDRGAKPRTIFDMVEDKNKKDEPIKEKTSEKENFLNESNEKKKSLITPVVLSDVTNSSDSAAPAKTSKPNQTNLNYFKVENKEVNYLNEPWVCQKCTLENPGWRVFCEICSSVKPRFLFDSGQSKQGGRPGQKLENQKPEPELKPRDTPKSEEPKKSFQKSPSKEKSESVLIKPPKQKEPKQEEPKPSFQKSPSKEKVEGVATKPPKQEEPKPSPEKSPPKGKPEDEKEELEENLEELRKKRMNFFTSRLESLSESSKNESPPPEVDRTKLKKILKDMKDCLPKDKPEKRKESLELDESSGGGEKETKAPQPAKPTAQVKTPPVQDDGVKYGAIKKKQPVKGKKEKVVEAYIVTTTTVLEDYIIKKSDRAPKVSASVQTKSSLPVEPESPIRPPPRTKKQTTPTEPTPEPKPNKKKQAARASQAEGGVKGFCHEDLEELTQRLTQAEGLADFRANIETMPLNTEMNTVAVNRLLRKLETAINCGDHFVAAGLAKELALMKINCSVTRQVSVPPAPSSSKITIELYVEDKVSHQGPIPIQVSPAMTLLQLKKKIQQEFNIPIEVQRWILGKSLATDDDKTLESHGINADSCSVFLYLVAPDKPKAEKVSPEKLNQDPKPEKESASPIQPHINRGKGWYYNFEEDHYSYCEDSEDESRGPSPETKPPDPKPSSNPVQPPEETNKPSVFDLKSREAENEVEKELKLISRNSVRQKVEKLNKTFAENNKPTRGNLRSSPETWKCVACTFVNSPGKFACSACNAKKIAARMNLPKVDERARNESPKRTNVSAGNVHYNELIQLQDADLVPNAEAFNCPICMVDYAPGEGCTLKDCLHTFCRTCLINTVQFSEDAEVKCPYLDDTYSCTSVLQQREIKALVPRGIFELHLAKSVKEAENKIGNAFHCKTPDCKGWCIYEDNVNEFHCPVCKLINCMTCQAIHTGINCREYQERMRDASETDVDAKKTREMLDQMVEKGEAMACPRCQVVLMKKWGCDWLRCSMCKTEICWVTRGFRWGPGGKGDTSAGCKCGVNGVKCHPKCNYCH